MRKRWWAVFLTMFVLYVGLTFGMREIRKIQWSEQDLKDELQSVSEENNRLREQLAETKRRVVSAEDDETADNSAQSEGVDDIGRIVPVSELSLIDVGYAERIRSVMSDDDMVVLGVYPVGEDSAESMKRFFLCDGRHYAEFYVADYITGEIINLSRRNPSIDISYYIRDDADQSITAYADWEIQIEDYDGNGELDILLVLSFDKMERERGFYYMGGVLLWLQKQGSFLPVNRSYCGYYSGWWESEFSVKIAELEEKFKEEQNPDDWSIDQVSTWVREELLEGQTESLNKTLEDPKKQLPYDQRREPRNLHPELKQDQDWHYNVRISENPYSEKQINEWLKDFYEKDEEKEKEFMGETREDEATMTEQERLDAGFYYASSVWPQRVDDAVICLMTSTYYYAGGAHGNDLTDAVVFDTRNGEVLRLEDVVESRERFFDFALDYIEANDELNSFSGETEDMKESLQDEKWCFTDYGLKVFWNGMNGAGIYSREIPYELLTDYLKEEYLPTSRAVERGIYHWEHRPEGKILMDVNADGEIDTLIVSVSEEEPIQLSVNETVSELDPQYQGKLLSEQRVWVQSVILERQEDGMTEMNLTVDIWLPEEETACLYKYVYRIDGESVILETEYEVEEQY